MYSTDKSFSGVFDYSVGANAMNPRTKFHLIMMQHSELFNSPFVN